MHKQLQLQNDTHPQTGPYIMAVAMHNSETALQYYTLHTYL